MSDKQESEFFLMTPYVIYHDPDISSTAKLILTEILNKLKVQRQLCFASNQHFADLFGLKKTNVSYHISQLVDQKWIKTESVDSCRKRTCPLQNRGNHRHIMPGRTLSKILDSLSKKTIDPPRKNSTIKYNRKDKLKISAKQSTANPSEDNTLQKTEGPESIVVGSEWQSRAKYYTDKLGSNLKQQSSVLAICRDNPPALTDAALTFALDYSNARDRTKVFLFQVNKLKMGSL